MNVPTLFSLDGHNTRPQPRKRVRAVSSGRYRAMREDGALSRRAADVLRELAAFYNKRAYWPTVQELTFWMFNTGDLPRLDSRLIAPRITELSRGVMNRETREYVGGGVIEALPARRCRVAGSHAHPWRIREQGATFRVSE